MHQVRRKVHEYLAVTGGVEHYSRFNTHEHCH